MQTIHSQFNKGLALGPPADLIGEGYLRRNRGMHYLSYGSYRSRFGSLKLSSLNAHSIEYFSNLYHYGVSTSLYRSAALIKSSLSGDTISFAKMPPVAGIADYLFGCEGSDPFKVDSAGNVTSWGFAIPASNPSAAAAAGGSLADATWGYQITYYNSTTGHRSNSNGTTVSATTSGANNSVALTAIPDPTSIDTQISHVEIWRTVANGTALFLLTRIAAGTTTYTDDGSDTISSTELPTDNFTPLSTFFNCLGPHNASMFWLSSNSIQRGRVYYSPIGRAESYQSWVNICSNDTPLNKLFLFQSQLGVIGEGGIYIIGGGNPYQSRQVSGCPGTTSPSTVSVIPNIGVIYEASDGVRLFDGTTSVIVTPGAVDRLFRGESVGDLSSFSGSVSAYCRDEYIISDSSQTLAFDFKKARWRDLGVGMSAIYYNTETDEIAATISGAVLDFENETKYKDNTTSISISLELPHLTFPDDRKRTLQHITFDISTEGEQVTATLIHDNSETTLGVLQHSNRTNETIPIGIDANEFGLRLTGSLSTGRVELFKITYNMNEL